MAKYLDAIKNDPDYQALRRAELSRDEARAEVQRLRKALRSVENVGDRAAVMVARDALASTQERT